MTSGDIRLKGHGRQVTRAVWGPACTPDIGTLSLVSNRRDDLHPMEEIK